MAIGTVTTNYSGRNKDINIMAYPNPKSPETQPVPLTFGKISSYCAGIEKLIQRYMLTLLTVKGSQPYDPEFGTDFLKYVRSANLLTYNDLSHYFNFANYEVLNLFKQYQALHADLPLDEQIDTAVLDSLTTVDNRIQFNVKIYTKAGETVDFVMPIPVN